MSSYIYLVAGDGLCKGFYKIGKAENPAKRIKQFTKMPFGMQIAHIVKCDNTGIIESKLHKFFSDKRVNGEWFTLSPEQVSMFVSCNDESDFLEMIGSSLQINYDDLGGRVVITFGAYLDELRAAEKQKPPTQRHPVPTIKELAEVIGVHQVTLTNIVTGHIDRLSIDTARKVMDEMWRRGFKPEISDFIKYVPPQG